MRSVRKSINQSSVGRRNSATKRRPDFYKHHALADPRSQFQRVAAMPANFLRPAFISAISVQNHTFRKSFLVSESAGNRGPRFAGQPRDLFFCFAAARDLVDCTKGNIILQLSSIASAGAFEK